MPVHYANTVLYADIILITNTILYTDIVLITNTVLIANTVFITYIYTLYIRLKGFYNFFSLSRNSNPKKLMKILL